MPRADRKKCNCGIYHIMLLGINRQQIFEDEEDCGAKYTGQGMVLCDNGTVSPSRVGDF